VTEEAVAVAAEVVIERFAVGGRVAKIIN